MAKPKWMVFAEAEIGTREEPENRGPAIRRYIALGGCGHEGDPWCKIFVNAAIKSAGLPIENNAMALSIKNDPNFDELDGPAFGCVVVFWRGSPQSGTGHIGFYVGENEDGTRIRVLGGNEGDMVKEAWFPKASHSFGLAGYYWPDSVDDPEGGALVVDDDGEPVGSAA